MYQVARNVPYIVLNKTQVTLKNLTKYLLNYVWKTAVFHLKVQHFILLFSPSLHPIHTLSLDLFLSLFLFSFLSLSLSGLEQYLSDTLVIEL